MEAGGRVTNLDALRGFAVLLMIEQHVGIWLWRGPGPDESYADFPVLVAFNAMAAPGAPLFFLLAGVGAALLCARSQPGTDRRLFARGILVMGFGYVMNFASPSWFSWGSWFALHLMGFGIACSALWRRLSDGVLVLVALALLVGAPVMQSVLETGDDLYLSNLRDTSLPGGVLRLALVEGQYPLLPWLAVVVLGFLSGRWIVGARAQRVLALGIALAVLGGLSYATYVVVEPPRPSILYFAGRLKLGFFPPSVSMVCLVAAPAFVLTWAAVVAQRRWPLASSNALVAVGRASLTVFLIHAPLFRELSRPLGLWSGLGPAAALSFVFGFIALCLVLARLWQRVGFRYGAEWLLRRAVP